MKTIGAMVVLAGMGYGAAALAQPLAAATLAATPLPALSEQSMTKAEKIKQLKPATNYVELMQLLNDIHEHLLLTDPSFSEDDNIHRLFGSGEIVKSGPHSNAGPSFSKTMIPSPSNPFQFRVFVFLGGSEFGGLDLGNYETPFPVTPDLIEAYLPPTLHGDNPYDPTKFMTNETHEYAARLPLATHPKGHWAYGVSEIYSGFRRSILIKLDRSAQAINLSLQQFKD